MPELLRFAGAIYEADVSNATARVKQSDVDLNYKDGF